MSFQEIQRAFMAHIRDPQQHSFDGDIEDRRLDVYRELFFNNIVGFLDSGFPVLKSLYDDDTWLALARQFFATHNCRSPYFIDISKEFVEFLANEYELQQSDPVFMRELAHYEWLELDISVRRLTRELPQWVGEALPQTVAMSELASLVSYPYPVHQISPDFQPQEMTETTFLVVYRDDEDEVRFTLCNPVTAQLLDAVQQNNPMELVELVALLQQSLPQIPPQNVQEGVHQTVKQLLQQQILVSGEE